MGLPGLEKSCLRNCMKVPWYPCFHFYLFCLEPTIRKNVWMRTIPVTVNHVESAILKATWSHLCSKFFLSNNEAHWQRHLKDILWLKILRIWTDICANSFVGKYHETNIDEGAWKIISCTKIRTCSSKIIATGHFAYYCILLFLSDKSSFLNLT